MVKVMGGERIQVLARRTHSQIFVWALLTDRQYNSLCSQIAQEVSVRLKTKQDSRSPVETNRWSCCSNFRKIGVIRGRRHLFSLHILRCFTLVRTDFVTAKAGKGQTFVECDDHDDNFIVVAGKEEEAKL